VGPRVAPVARPGMAILDSILLSFHSTAAFFSPSLSPCLILLDQHLLKVSRVEALKHNPMPVWMLPEPDCFSNAI
jgi:hypothetical protein